MIDQHRAADSLSTSSKVSLGESVAWFLFCAVSLHLILLYPYIVLIPGERTNLFSGLLCALCLLAALIFGRKESHRIRSAPAIISLVLLALIVLNSLFSAAPDVSSPRGFVIAAAGLGGFWCSRILLNSASRQKVFQWLCILGLLCMIVLAFAAVISGKPYYSLVDSHWHPVVSRAVLLSFAPIALLWAGSPVMIGLGLVLLVLSYLVCMMGARIGLESAVGIPSAMCFFAAVLREWQRKHLAVILAGMLLIATIAGGHFFYHSYKVQKQHISVAYRIESIYFSWEIAKMHPYLGLGLWAPRDELVEKYQPRYHHVPKENFVQWTKELRTSENTLLTLMADAGFPFMILYSVGIAVLYFMLLRMVIRPPANFFFHPLVLFLPLTGMILHLQVVDGLFHPQVSWFFHVLLGLIPTSASLSDRPAVKVRGIVRRILAFLGVLTLGIFLGYLLPTSVSKFL